MAYDIEQVKNNDMPFWIEFIVCKIHHISKENGPVRYLGRKYQYFLDLGWTYNGFFPIKVFLGSLGHTAQV